MPATLADILAAQPDEVVARYAYRNPEQTLNFFGIEPGMTVVEALPGGGWYVANFLLHTSIATVNSLARTIP